MKFVFFALKACLNAQICVLRLHQTPTYLLQQPGLSIANINAQNCNLVNQKFKYFYQIFWRVYVGDAMQTSIVLKVNLILKFAQHKTALTLLLVLECK